MKGKVKWFNAQKGYGFVRPETGGPDVFVHITASVEGQDIFENDEIEFDTAPGRNGKPQATNVRIV